MHYKIFPPFNEEGQVMILGPEIHSWTAWVLYDSDSLLVQAWDLTPFVFLGPAVSHWAGAISYI